MKDYFALLNFERRPWFGPEEVNARFVELSAAAHPDRVHGAGAEEVRGANERFAELNSAAACLRDSKERLHHLIQLETGAAPAWAQSIPSELMDLFGRVGQVCREVDQFLMERAKASSPMVQAELFARGLDWTSRLEELQAAIGNLRAQAEAELKAISEKWPAEKPIERLKTIAYIFATTGRWEGQLKERFGALAAV
jgi:DnaJ-domain-containing protein 1